MVDGGGEDRQPRSPLRLLEALASEESVLAPDLRHLEIYTMAGLLTILWHGPVDADAVVVMAGGAMGGLLGPAGGLYHDLGTRFAAAGIGTMRVGYRKPNDLGRCVHDVAAAADLASRTGASPLRHDRPLVRRRGRGPGRHGARRRTARGSSRCPTQSAGCEDAGALGDRRAAAAAPRRRRRDPPAGDVDGRADARRPRRGRDPARRRSPPHRGGGAPADAARRVDPRGVRRSPALIARSGQGSAPENDGAGDRNAGWPRPACLVRWPFSGTTDRNEGNAQDGRRMGPARSAGGRLGGRGRPRHRVLALAGRGARDAVPREGRRSSRSARSTTAASRSTASTTSRRCGAATRRTRSTPRSATGCGTARPARSCAGFVVPRGITVLAGGTADADARSFTLHAKAGDPQYSIGENKYLAQNASTLQLQRDDHHQRRRHLVVRRDDDAPDEGVRRAVRAHRPQHVAPRGLSRPGRDRNREPARRAGGYRRRDGRPRVRGRRARRRDRLLRGGARRSPRAGRARPARTGSPTAAAGSRTPSTRGSRSRAATKGLTALAGGEPRRGRLARARRRPPARCSATTSR